MRLKARKVEPEALQLWSKRADALKAGAYLLSQKPDRDHWTSEDLRLWRYALAISHRMDRMH